MGITKVDELHTGQARAYLGGNPSSPSVYYGSGNEGDVDSAEWRGGEISYNPDDNRIYIQTATSGTTATWYRLAEQFV